MLNLHYPQQSSGTAWPHADLPESRGERQWLLIGDGGGQEACVFNTMINASQKSCI